MQSKSDLVRPVSMAKKSKKAKSNKISNTPQGPWLTRRRLLTGIVLLPLTVAAGAAIHQYDIQHKQTHDLSVIGQGAPVVVQIHDPSCSLCRRLMANAKSGIKANPEVMYRVADITTAPGKSFQNRYGVPNVTLLLFNRDGKLVETVQGVTPGEELSVQFNKLSRS